MPASGGSFDEQVVGTFTLTEGANEIVFRNGWGWYYLDYVRLVPAAVEKPEAPAAPLVDADATPAAKALHAFLKEIYGKKVLAGQQSLDDIRYVESVTGLSPAVGAFDLMDYSPSRVERGADPSGSVERWIDWAQEGGGIVSLSWHWNAPTGLIDRPGQEWWRGFYTDATTFDFSAALDDTTSAEYDLLLRDIDAIAAQLRKFERANQPVLWRPLHEASGGWFWWGAQGAEPFKALWRLVFDRLTQHHGLHNLIWVSTHGDVDWYPGDAYVDVVGLDIYTDPSASMSGHWQQAQEQFGGRKIVALSESGTLPDPDKLRAFEIWWSWFSVWSGEFIRDIDAEVLRRVYRDPDVITLDELPALLSTSPADPSERHLTFSIFPNPTDGRFTISAHTEQAARLRWTLVDVLGRVVREGVSGDAGAGVQVHQVVLDTVASGAYFLHLHTGAASGTERLFIIRE